MFKQVTTTNPSDLDTGHITKLLHLSTSGQEVLPTLLVD
jgi:hypothetical protein